MKSTNDRIEILRIPKNDVASQQKIEARILSLVSAGDRESYYYSYTSKSGHKCYCFEFGIHFKFNDFSAQFWDCDSTVGKALEDSESDMKAVVSSPDAPDIYKR